ncbi:MAG: hypothetical protein HY692_03050 [Cyanobacteria bacterium NC_groundwater_1444_Ag_S-0.65um_54_12]|nr:hypothetical protein [Cyanobacteria bacterium NC_groundwater_1444_Ag_S-0.65um_54_12]
MRSRHANHAQAGQSLKLTLLCQQCGTRCQPVDRYCYRCGQSLLRQTAASIGFIGDTKRLFLVRRAVWFPLLLLLAVLAIATVAIVGQRSPASLVGLRLGDGSSRLEQLLGQPPRPPLAMLWKPGHKVLLWHYDLDPGNGIPNLTVTLVDGLVCRIAVLSRHYPTSEGLQVGDELSKARGLYGTGIEEAPESGLVPYKFLHHGQVIKVIVQQGRTEILAISLEIPESLILFEFPPIHSPDDTSPELLNAKLLLRSTF